jgi:secreted trypsin-like serine protease
MRLVNLLMALLVSFAGVSRSGWASAQEHNWMREFVQLRQIAMAERFLDADAAEQVRSRFSTRIVGGTVAAPNAHPFQVGLLTKRIARNFRAWYCGGTLVKPNVVVTAAHCSDFVTAREVQVLTGTQRLDGSGVRRNVLRIDIHPGWDPGPNPNNPNMNNDVAVWTLASSADGIPLASLAPTDPPVGTNLLATGWGDTTDNEGFEAYSVALRQVVLPLVSRNKCNTVYPGDITNKMICAGFADEDKDTCFGDSGGPLTRKKDHNFTVLVGITSWGIGCADRYGVYTRVSEFRTWIISKFP